MSIKREIFISVDIETAGPIPGEYSLLTIGACVVDDETKTFSCELKPINRNADPKALEITGLSLDELEKAGIKPEEAMQKFTKWLTSLADGEVSFIFVGFNAGFDWSFINYYFHKFLGKNPFHVAALDIKSYYMGAAKCSWEETRSSYITKKLNPQRQGSHDALDDALYQAELFKLMREKL